MSALVLILLTACLPEKFPSESSDCTWYADADGDGFGDPEAEVLDSCDEAPSGTVEDSNDCDDGDPAINPDAAEICDGIDQDCSGVADDGLEVFIAYVDSDGDGYGDEEVESCEPWTDEGYAEYGGDCDDSNDSAYPGAEVDCTDADLNCDGVADNTDQDGDGLAGCEGDCDDTDASISPVVGVETCDGVDQDCDGDIDEEPTDGSPFYLDLDGDGYGDPEQEVSECDAPEGYVDNAEDCDDARDDVSPGVDELCNGFDDDCDGDIDEDDAIDASTWYVDADGDGYGDTTATTSSCSQPEGYAATADDCDDSDTAYNPGAEESCTDPTDYNCDGSTGAVDADGDGYYACEECDDGDAAINPDAEELCDGVDNNCDGDVDGSDSTDATTWYADSDTDGYGDPDNTQDACSQPSGYTSDASDCDDSDSAISPSATETCDNADNDCDGDTDEDDAADASVWYSDSDGDSYGSSSVTTTACDQPSGYVADATDCDDATSAINPGETETCNSVDDDCDGTIDEDDASDAVTWYGDGDGDGFGDSATTDVDCDQPSGYVLVDGDCDDGDFDIKPGEDEYCDGVDNDCDGNTDEGDAVDKSTWYADGDSDGYGNSSATKSACDAPSGYVADNTDCDDGDSTSNPGGTEVCDGADNDCNGSVDDNASDETTWYYDADGDSYGLTDSSQDACDQPSKYVAADGDCDDGDSGVNPGAAEQCDGQDTDCNGAVDDGLPDADSDGTADCYDNCPVFADPSLTSNGDGSESSPYMSINDAIVLRGGYCDEIELLGGTFTETVDYGGDDLYIYASPGESVTVDGDGNGSVFTFANGETSAAILEGVTITGGSGTPGTGVDIGLRTTSSGYADGGGVYIVSSDPTILDCTIKDNTVTGYGGGVMAYDYDGEFSGNTVEGNDASYGSFAGGGMYLSLSTADILDNEFIENTASGSSGDGGGMLIFYSDPTVDSNVFEANTTGSGGTGDAVRYYYYSGGVFSNNLLFDHDESGKVALAVTDASSVDVINNTIVDNNIGIYIAYNSYGSPTGDFVNNLITNSDDYGVYSDWWGNCYYYTDFSYTGWRNNSTDDTNSSYCEDSTDSTSSPGYTDRSNDDYSLKSTSAMRDAGDDTDGYGVTADIEGTSRPTGSYSIGAYER